jgi:NDP-sugar pyrophosphorylase family protein
MDPVALGDLPRGRPEVVTVDVKAILVVTGPDSGASRETLAEVPLALLPVLGRPVVSYILDRLQRFGVQVVAVISEDAPAPYLRPAQRPGVKWIPTGSNGNLWRAAEASFSEFAQNGADLVLALRVGAYAELDLEQLVQFHLEQRHRVTCVEDADGPLDMFVISASRRNDAAYMFRHRFASFRTACGRFPFAGYANRLADVRDLRRLATDALGLKTGIVPGGRQIKPGVWLEESARIHRGARILAPAFVGAYSKIRAAVVLTRGAVIEHHSEIDCGTVVENASVLPYTYLGAGLDLSHAVTGFRRVLHLERNVTVEINDPKLVGRAPTAAPLRVLAAAATLAGFLPRHICRGLLSPSPELPAAVKSPPAPKAPAAIGLESVAAETDRSDLSANFAVARRYGNQ